LGCSPLVVYIISQKRGFVNRFLKNYIVKNAIMPVIAQIAEPIVKIHARIIEKYSNAVNKSSINISFDLSF
jgi:hypothetical protein